MKILDFEQNSPEWMAARAKLPTASNFDKIITSTGKESSQADGYANSIIAAMIFGTQESFSGNAWTERGKNLEESAVQFYEFQRDIITEKVGLCISDCGTYGASPDRLIGGDGLLEIKCPAAHTHIGYMLSQGADKDYNTQVQGQLLVTGRKWVDLVSYHPELPAVIIRIERDDEFLAKLEPLLKKFDETVKAKYARMIELGYINLEKGNVN